MSSIVQDFSPVIYYSSQLSFTIMPFSNCMLSVWEKFIFKPPRPRRWQPTNHSYIPAGLFVVVFMPRHQKVAGYYVIPSEILSVRPSAPTTILVSATPPTVLGQSFWNFTGVLRMVWRLCILFFQNPEIIFYHFFPIFMPRHQKVAGYYVIPSEILSVRPSVCPSIRPSAPTTILVSATPPTVLGQSFWNFTGVLRMVWRYAYCFFRILKLFFITFFPFLT